MAKKVRKKDIETSFGVPYFFKLLFFAGMCGARPTNMLQNTHYNGAIMVQNTHKKGARQCGALPGLGVGLEYLQV